MKCTIHVYLLNDNFSPEHAEAHYNGEESENNLKYEWEDEIVITSDVKEVNIIENGILPLMGELPNGSPFQQNVENMLLFEIVSNDPPTANVGASKSIVDSHSMTEENGTIILKLFLKDYEPMANPMPGVYIASKEFPKELVF
jgi:hypothetical protein